MASYCVTVTGVAVSEYVCTTNLQSCRQMFCQPLAIFITQGALKDTVRVSDEGRRHSTVHVSMHDMLFVFVDSGG